MTEALIGACFVAFGFERVAGAVVAAFDAQIEQAVEAPVDAKSALQELLARRRARVTYAVIGESGPAHRRTFEVEAIVDGESVGTGAGRSKKAAEQVAAEEALKRLAGVGDASDANASLPDRGREMYLRSIEMKGFKSFPERTKLEFSPGVSVIVGPERLRQVEHHRRGALGARRAEPGRDPRRLDAGRDLGRRRGRRPAPRRRGRGRDRQLRRAARRPSSPRSRSSARSTAPATASTGSTAPAAASSTWSRSSPTPTSAARCTR